MWNIWHTYGRNKGFTLIEIILTLGVSSIIALSLVSILRFSINACGLGDEKDEILLHGRYAIEFIKDDIKAADRIISSDLIKNLKLKYPYNIGFIILKIDDEKTPNEYTYISYHRKDDKIVRVACTRVDKKYPSYAEFSGNNDLCEFVYDIENTRFDTENKMIHLEFIFKHNNGHKLILKSDIYIRCSIDY